MKAFARFTSVIFIVIGILIILGGIIFAFSSIVSVRSQAPAVPGLMPDMSGLMVVARAFGGGMISLQGFFLAAIGQGLWLLADIANNTERARNALPR